MLSSEGHHEAPIDSKCRMCYKAEEHIKRIVAGCTTLAPSEYTNTHKKVAGYIHWVICKHMGLQVTVKYYEHVPETSRFFPPTSNCWALRMVQLDRNMQEQKRYF